MRIALDARTIFRPVRRGTGKNLLDLYRHVAALRPDWQIIAMHRREGRSVNRQALLPQLNIKNLQIEMLGDRLGAWERWRLPLAAWTCGSDVLHCPSNTCPAWMPVPTVVTIHDLIPLDMHGESSSAEVQRYEASIRAACQRAAWIICPSVYTRNQLVSRLGADANRITVNPWAADSSVHRVAPERWGPILKKYDIRPPFVLNFGAADPRKNTSRLLEAWSHLTPRERGDWRLLVVGLEGASREIFSSEAVARGVTASVRLHDFADEADIPTLLSAAGVLVYPSLAEGFGLPILDAWTTRTPVLTSNATSLPEVAADAALLVDPHDVAALTASLTEILRDGKLRSDLVARGTKRLVSFSWKATAQRFIWTLDQVSGQKAPLRRAA